jgi:hypothetical protein
MWLFKSISRASSPVDSRLRRTGRRRWMVDRGIIDRVPPMTSTSPPARSRGVETRMEMWSNAINSSSAAVPTPATRER